ncbi:MAG: hypothetical protein PUP91_34495 [Rhizonema sp. PD37]|nr:hypothetical protein [Rhizonema sp. PD37]
MPSRIGEYCDYDERSSLTAGHLFLGNMLTRWRSPEIGKGEV